MNQATLPFAEPLDLARVPRARRDDPETSQAAARRAKVAQHAHGWAILRVLRLGGSPRNAHEIAALTGGEHQITTVRLTQVQVARSMKEMLDVGLVVVDGERDGSRCYRLPQVGGAS